MSEAIQKLFFIVGIGRSGTTLLQSMMNAHPEITFPPESHFVKKYIAPQIKGKFGISHSKEVLVQLLKEDEDLQRLNIDIEKCFSETDISKPLFLKDLFIKILEAYGNRFSKPHIGDKDPLNLEFLPEIKKAFPDAWIIHIIRDPRDVILSRIKSGWGKKNPFAVHVFEYDHHLRRARKNGPALFGGHYVEIFYEKLLEDPEKELKVLCRKLDLNYSNDMLNYHEKADQIVTENEKDWKGNVFKPVMRSNTNKWRNNLSEKQVITIEGTVADLMNEFGYELSGYGNDLLRKFYSLPVKLCSIAYKAKSIS